MPEILIGACGVAIGLGLFFLYGFLLKRDARSRANSIVEEANRRSESKVVETELRIKELEIKQQAKVEKERVGFEKKLHEKEKSLDRRDSQLTQQADGLRKQEAMVQVSQNKLKQKLAEAEKNANSLNEIYDKQRKELLQITGLSKEEASKRLLKLLEDELADEVGGRILAHEQKMAEICDAKAREMLLVSIRRYAASHTADSTTSTVDIPNDDMKGRIIGREGRNIRAFEKETGIDVIIDDTPGVVIVSGFDPVRREVARQSMDKLIADGRIHPTRIEEIVSETQREVEGFLKRKGAEAAQEVDVHGLSERVILMLGRLHFRTSYGQNVLRHSIEVAFISGMIAEMMEMDGSLARRCGLLHDIGKAADHELEGGHPKIGADLLKRNNEGPEVVHAAFGHHDEILIEHPFTDGRCNGRRV